MSEKQELAPSAFNERETIGYCWAIHYKGQLVHREDITFRFRGQGDDILVVKVDGECVLNACGRGTEGFLQPGLGGWSSSSADSRRFYMGNSTAVVGEWITLRAGEPKKMEVVIGEVPGGTFCSMLTVEVEDVEYGRNRQSGPILPMFKTEEPRTHPTRPKSMYY
ncbi:hypothetical protein PDESU_04842 [Pontiella desulfatans]|uniref:PA14 domain-containing protein n=1 Tax=Pontiella desulfatans TaxID=2750659 RepID=A0A6C2U9Q4_PONDE|nr:hypothetical protein [Pontiella desulfatans]VGO16251.1 hypothetical protein PDESU_04842 [Pontiella desulfatans]